MLSFPSWSVRKTISSWNLHGRNNSISSLSHPRVVSILLLSIIIAGARLDRVSSGLWSRLAKATCFLKGRAGAPCRRWTVLLSHALQLSSFCTYYSFQGPSYTQMHVDTIFLSSWIFACTISGSALRVMWASPNDLQSHPSTSVFRKFLENWNTFLHVW